MREFRVRLFPKESEKPKGLINIIKNFFNGGKGNLRQGDRLDCKIGRATEYDYKYVNVYSNGELIGEIKKNGIDELIEKGALIGATYSGYIHDVPQITLNCLETHEYSDKPEYKEWSEKLHKKLADEEEERERLFPVELNNMLKDLSNKTDLFERHLIFQNIVTQTYRRRKDPEMLKICIEIGEKHLLEFKKIAPVIKKRYGGSLQGVTTFKNLAIVLAEREEYDKAIEVCKMAMSYNLEDGTKTGFKGRLKRIEKKKGRR